MLNKKDRSLMNSLLVIDDDMDLCELLCEYLQPEGFTVEMVHDADQGLEKALSGKHGIVVLDVMLPGMSGFDVLRHIRSKSQIPVLMLTARGEDVDRIVGLEMGADDYLPKPFNPRELLARIRAVQRRTEVRIENFQQSGVPVQKIQFSDIVLDPGTRTVEQNNKNIELTAVEFSLLYELLQKAGQVVSRDELAQKVLGRELSLFDRSIDVHVSSLRKKLGHEVDGMERIKTVRSVGYLYAMPSDSGQ